MKHSFTAMGTPEQVIDLATQFASSPRNPMASSPVQCLTP
jgi:hypothetical protein